MYEEIRRKQLTFLTAKGRKITSLSLVFIKETNQWFKKQAEAGLKLNNKTFIFNENRM